MYLAGDKRARPFQTLAAMKMYEELIVTGAWWDYVDQIASHSVGPILKDYPGPMRRKMLSWCKSDNLWKRRAAIICQLGHKAETDLELLYACIEPSLGSREFFLQKAIGWALRQYAWTDGAEKGPGGAFLSSFARAMMNARIACVSSGFSTAAKETMPRSWRTPFSTTWSKPSCVCSSGVRVRSGNVAPRIVPFSP